jgi:predicted membrane channel-forming protein YqfA (hemolysin III family)
VPLVDLFLTLLWFFLFVAWVWVVVSVVVDIFRSDDLSGWAKAFWVALVAFVPWIGVFIYLVARGRSMAERGSRWAMGEDVAPRR